MKQGVLFIVSAALLASCGSEEPKSSNLSSEVSERTKICDDRSSKAVLKRIGPFVEKIETGVKKSIVEAYAEVGVEISEDMISNALNVSKFQQYIVLYFKKITVEDRDEEFKLYSYTKGDKWFEISLGYHWVFNEKIYNAIGDLIGEECHRSVDLKLIENDDRVREDPRQLGLYRIDGGIVKSRQLPAPSIDESSYQEKIYY